jgi:squalene-hopene/tetraprenyl-beta-curcumene cyclase
VRGLLAAGEATDDDAIAAATNWLTVEQQTNGGWCDEATENHSDRTPSSRRVNNSASQTAWAVLALVAAGRSNDPATRRGINFLLESQDEVGGWVDKNLAAYDPVSKRWFSNDLHSIAWPLLALSGWAVAINSAELAADDQLSLRLADTFAEV